MHSDLERLMNAYYKSVIISKSNTDKIKEDLLQVFEDTPAVIEEAKALLSAYKKVSDRCFVSKTKASFLEGVLNG